MTTYIKVKDGNYTLVDNEVEFDLKVVQPKGWAPTLELPENSSGRKLVNIENMMKHLDSEGRFEIKARAPRSESSEPREKAPSKKWTEYLSEDDKILLEELKARAEANRQKAIEEAKAERNDPLKRALKEMQKWEAKVAELKAMKENEETTE